MARLTIPFARDGLRLPIIVRPPAAVLAQAGSAGRSTPRLFPGWAEIDTGASPTAVALPVLAQLGLQPTRTDDTLTAAGIVSVKLYRVTLAVPPMFGVGVETVIADDLEVTALSYPIPGSDLLLGLDVLLNCRLLIDGPGRTFTLDF